MQQRRTCKQARSSIKNNLVFSSSKHSYPHQTVDVLIEDVPEIRDISQGKAHSKCQAQFDRRVLNSLIEFIYELNLGDYQIQRCVQKLLRMRRAERGCKGLRESTGVVIFMVLGQQFGWSFNRFCRENSMEIKMSYRKYKLFNRLFPKKRPMLQDSPLLEQSLQIKVQQKGDINLLSFDQREEVSIQNEFSMSTLREDNHFERSECQRAIDLVYKNLFRSPCFQINKKEVTNSLTDRVIEVQGKFEELALWKEISKANIYYIIFAVIKFLDYSIGFSQYNQIVKKQTGYSLNKEQSDQIKKAYYSMEVSRRGEDEEQRGRQSYCVSMDSGLFDMKAVKKQQLRWQCDGWQCGDIKQLCSPQVMQQQFSFFGKILFYSADSGYGSWV